MKLLNECYHCFHKMIEQSAAIESDDPEIQREIILQGEKFLDEGFHEKKVISDDVYSGMFPTWVSVKLLKSVFGCSTTRDYYKDAKYKEMILARELFRKIQPLYGPDLRSCIELSVLGNIIDFHRDIGELEEAAIQVRCERLSFAIDDVSELAGFLDSHNRGVVLMLADNSGEVFFDGPLVQHLVARGYKTYYAVKEYPFLNDITVGDLKNAGIEDSFPHIVSTGTGALVDLSIASPVFLEKIQESDLILSKGQANYDCISAADIGTSIFYLLRIKCECVRQSLGVPLDSYVAKFDVNEQTK